MISSSATIAASSIIEPGVVIGPHVVIGPFCFISAGVHIGEGTRVASHVVINGDTRIGRNNMIGMESSIGEVSQDLKYAGEAAGLEIGDDNKIGRHATFHRGTAQGGGFTRIGHRNVFDGGVHIGHDCQVGNDTFIGENSGLAGHVTLGDTARIEAMCAVHQFCIVGAGAYLLANTCVVQDVPPYILAQGNRAVPKGINEQATVFAAADDAQQNVIRHLYDLLYHQQAAADEVKTEIQRLSAEFPLLQCFNEFFTRSARGIIR
ncbi:acyl-ACP--UDP-N-acetylglucosamine O-acyltransferase [Rahnella sikkimica]|uniref:Acyl-[acyl-carrier-protein]--UDP-N-acetylglucosamine O-acyltransferase n=1 Tax=Rahnella sikkimica TaxID=1805933 RepID=A0A2L1UWR5_9GAMM|nr:acyl-ACP--UDP-N-acetylglucosamine O-acyltransferase [Rahnella sikkimica]AVF37341.1 acyl-[acyl-carrier-protein]--UDP-N-acetylglucosamine O-acyltransferase [Rahnella sikkimica]